MNERMKPMSQRRGRASISASTLSLAMVISGTSVSTLVSKICLGNNGRNGSSSDAPAMLNMLPKFALVAIKHVLQRVGEGRASLPHTLDQHIQILLQQHDVGDLLGHVHGALDGEADVGGVQRRGVVDPVAHVADDVARLAQGQDEALLLVGLHLGEHVHLADPMEERPVTHLLQLMPRQHRGVPEPDLARDGRRHQGVVAGDDLESHAELAEPADGRLDAGLGRIGEQDEAQKAHAGFAVLADPGLGAELLAGQTQGALATQLYRAKSLSICSRTLASGTATPAPSSAVVHTSSTWARAPLVIITLPSGPAARMERRLRRKS